MQRQDYIERMIAQIATAIAHVLGLARSGQGDQAERELDATWARVVGLRRMDIDRLDDATLRALLGGRRIPAAELLDAEAELKRLQGDLKSASRLEALATILRR